MLDVKTQLDVLSRENSALKAQVNRTNKAIMMIGGCLLIAVTAGAANLATRKNADFDLVTARQIRIVDADGNPKVLLAGEKQSSPQIVQGYVAVLDEKGNGSALLGHWGNGDVLWFENGTGDNLYLGKLKDSVVVQSYDTKGGHKNFRLYSDGTKSGLDFQERVRATTTAPADFQQNVANDLKYVGTP